MAVTILNRGFFDPSDTFSLWLQSGKLIIDISQENYGKWKETSQWRESLKPRKTNFIICRGAILKTVENGVWDKNYFPSKRPKIFLFRISGAAFIVAFTLKTKLTSNFVSNAYRLQEGCFINHCPCDVTLEIFLKLRAREEMQQITMKTLQKSESFKTIIETVWSRRLRIKSFREKMWALQMHSRAKRFHLPFPKVQK